MGSESLDMSKAVPDLSGIGGSFDVVILGSGAAGLTAAVAARALGLSALVLERAELIGGSSAQSYGGIWVACNEQARAHGISDDRELALHYLTQVAGSEADPKRMTALLDAAPRALRLLTSRGVTFRLTDGLEDYHYGALEGALPNGRSVEAAPFQGGALGVWRNLLLTPPGEGWRLPLQTIMNVPANRWGALIEAARVSDELCQGPGLVAQLLNAALIAGAVVRVNAAADGLLTTKNRVVGVRMTDGGIALASRGVILATGGFESDIALSERIENLPGYRSVYPASVSGDGLRIASALGGAFKVIQNNLGVLLGYENPPRGPVKVAANQELAYPHGLIVNREGLRFGNEASFQSLAPALRHFDSKTRRHQNLPCWLIFDRALVNKYGFGGGEPGSVPDWVLCAGTLTELAGLAGINSDGLVRSVDRFNSFASLGKDSDFQRGERIWSLARPSGDQINPTLGRVEKPPFYAVLLHPTILSASGLRADEHARVLNWSDVPIAGLYAAGNSAAHDDFGVGYQSGLSLSSSIAFALLAVESIVSAGEHPA